MKPSNPIQEPPPSIPSSSTASISLLPSSEPLDHLKCSPESSAFIAMPSLLNSHPSTATRPTTTANASTCSSVTSDLAQFKGNYPLQAMYIWDWSSLGGIALTDLMDRLSLARSSVRLAHNNPPGVYWAWEFCDPGISEQM
ncbi:hypothetical protein L1887_05755 [Cichorium endivia]|nr:hypothetical protein L1887_05755 [Cichorium endivia]